MEEASTIVLTGAAGNLGRALVKRLAPSHRLVLMDTREERLQGLDAPESAVRLTVDLLNHEAVAASLRSAREATGALHGLVTTVGGFGGGARLHEGPADDLARLLTLNVTTTGAIARAITPHLVDAGGGAIVTIGSTAALGADPNFVAYSVAKTAVLRLTEGLALELKEFGISANCVLPSTLDTPLNRQSMPDADPSGWVHPDQIAEVAAFLLSPAGAVLSGAALQLPGGLGRQREGDGGQ